MPRRFSHDASVLLASQLASLGLVFFAGVVTARMYDPELRGEYAMLTTIAAFVAVLSNFGMIDALVYFHHRGEAARTPTAAILLSAIAACLGLSMSAFLVPWFARAYFPVGGIVLAWSAVVSGSVAVFQRNAGATHMACHRFVLPGVSSVVQPVAFLLALLLLGSFGLRWMAIAYAGAWVLSTAVVTVPLARQVDIRSVDRAYLRGLLSFSSRSYAHVVFSQLNYRLDLFVVGYLLADLAQLAFYHVAGSLIALLWILPDAVGQAIYPRLTILEDERVRTRATVDAVRHVALLTGIGAFGLFAVSGAFVPLIFGARYDPAVLAVHLFLPGAVLMSIMKVLLRYLLSRNRHGLAVLASIAGLMTNVTANVILVRAYGLGGAAFAATLGWSVTSAVVALAFFCLGSHRREDWTAFPMRELGLYAERLSTIRGLLGGGRRR